jgi:peroxiredoxin
MKRLVNIIAVLGIFSTLLMNIACSQESKTQTTAKNTTEQSVASSLVYNVDQIIQTEQGKAINFSFNENGKTRTYDDLTKGKVVLLNFWGTWCPPCRAEIPDIIKLYDELKDQGLVVIGIAMERNEKQAHQIVSDFVTKNKLNYNVFPSRAVAEAYGQKFSTISAVPTTYIIDREGNVVEVIVGMRDKATFETAVKKYL